MNTRNSFWMMGLCALLIISGCTDTATAPNAGGEAGSGSGTEAPVEESLGSATAEPESSEASESAPAEAPEPPAEEDAPEEQDSAAAAPAPEESAPAAPAQDQAAVISFAPGPDTQKQVLEELILAEPGTVFQFEEGTYEFTDGLSLAVDHVTIRGRGMDKTILSFKNQEAGAEGLYITGNHVVVEDIAIEDTKGNAIKSLKADDIVYRRVRTEWTNGPDEKNGAYGLYPVSSKNVLVEECVAIGASDAGIYVGQSQHVIVRNCRAEYNVAGIEIENCYWADVYGCVATNNTGGILVFDLPDLPQQHGHDVRVFNNKVFGNNTRNFAPKGNIVGVVSAGTGMEVMANTNVEIFDNDIRDHGTVNIVVVSYLASGKDIKDPNYYPYSEGIHIHNNTFGPVGYKPDNVLGEIASAIIGQPLPDILWDGVVNEEKVVDGVVAKEASLAIHSNTKEGGELTFGNLGGLASLVDPANAKPSRDLAPHDHSLPPVAVVKIEGVE